MSLGSSQNPLFSRLTDIEVLKGNYTLTQRWVYSLMFYLKCPFCKQNINIIYLLLLRRGHWQCKAAIPLSENRSWYLRLPFCLRVQIQFWYQNKIEVCKPFSEKTSENTGTINRWRTMGSTKVPRGVKFSFEEQQAAAQEPDQQDTSDDCFMIPRMSVLYHFYITL